ncbi:sugar kinase [Oscillatoria sp. FACHB-1407]|uniref:PfkB family carbohydrate kinase n=1 Tax=Oscillatoria sp. FACHB-1407 TaxID=2692847 RepID=UPI0016890CE5|nr:PfkB family carbohydrate kinase [Oscillatoria sp. FACHB-1407]MBD2460406.1 sugar kinase [Oscillatoria sp. FACHB-1407]
MTYCGLFVGITTLDLIYLVEQVPTSNQKIVALDSIVAAGGPATNAAITFAHLNQQEVVGQCAMLLAALGTHPMTHLIRTDVESRGVAIADLIPNQAFVPPVSSILVTQATGERAVVALNAVKQQLGVEAIPAAVLEAIAGKLIDIVLIDGHQMAVGEAIAQQAKANGIPVVVDGGSWKPGFDRVLRWTDYAICSANFHPPGCTTEADVVVALRDLGIPKIAITHGEQPIFYYDSLDSTGIALPVPQIQAVDTLGAGDIFHGAFCHYILRSPFAEALAQAAAIAAQACQYFGTRRWMEGKREE